MNTDKERLEGFGVNGFAEKTSGSGCAQDVELSPALKALSLIEGINIAPALKLLMGKQRILETAAKSIGASMDSRIRVMKETLEDGNLDEFRNNIHSLKGSLAQIGADTLSMYAAQLEEAAKTGNTGYCSDNYPSFADNAVKLGIELNGIFSDWQEMF